MLIIDQNSNILLIYKGLYSTHGIIFDCLHLLFYINNQKFKQSPRKSLIVKQFLNNLPEQTRDEN